MGSGGFKAKKVVLLYSWLTAVGGSERVMLEEEKYLSERGFETYILTYDFREEVLFNGTYKPKNIHVFDRKYNSRNLLVQTVYRVLALRKKIRQIRPDIIITASPWDCVYVYPAILFTPFPYVAHIPQTIFLFTQGLIRHALIHRKVFHEIRESVIGHREFIPAKPPKSGLRERAVAELSAVAMYLGIRKAKRIFVHSKQMQWEVKKLYGKDSIALKPGFPGKLLSYKPGQDIKERLGLKDKRMILNVNRLDVKKRVDVLIRAFAKICPRFNDVMLVIGGVGTDEKRLKDLTHQLNLDNRVIFVGYIKDEELWDYYAACEVFAHPDWAEFDISPYFALALQKKVVWSSEMEIDEHLAGNRHVFAADPNADDMAEALEKALTTEVTESNDMSPYTWESYYERIVEEVSMVL
jgi:glycosyltransferase involved in cell wall biosynthesis